MPASANGGSMQAWIATKARKNGWQADMEVAGLTIRPTVHHRPRTQRGGEVVEPMNQRAVVRQRWNPLAKDSRKQYATGRIKRSIAGSLRRSLQLAGEHQNWCMYPIVVGTPD
ncbi:MAG: hypothetical protein U0528_16100 [Anaerolineae bacterium]